MSTALGLESAKTLRVIVPVGGTPTAAQELEIVAGSNITLTGTRTGNRVELSIAASGGGGGGGAPTGAEYIVASSNGSLTNEFVATNTATLTWDFSTPGQAKATVPSASTSAAGVVELATSAETTPGLAVQASDTRLSDARAPTGSASGDLGGTYPSPTVVDLTITSEAHGDLLYRGASAWVRLAASTADYVLTTQGAGAAPSWKAVSSILPTGLGALSTLLDGADQPNNELWMESWGWDGSARVRSWQPTGRTGYKLHQTTIRPDTGSYDSVGVAGPTASGTASVADVNGTRYFQYINTTEQSIQINGSATVLELDTVAIVDMCFVMYSDLTSHRFMVYLSDQAPGTMLAADAPTSGSYIMIRQSTSVPDTTAQIVCRDGSTTGAAVDTGITLAADTRYRVVWSMKPGGTEVQVWMGVERDALFLVATLDSGDNIPAAGTSMRVAIAGKSLAASTRGIRIAAFTSIAQ